MVGDVTVVVLVGWLVSVEIGDVEAVDATVVCPSEAIQRRACRYGHRHIDRHTHRHKHRYRHRRGHRHRQRHRYIHGHKA